MRKKRALLLALVVMLTAPGCMLVDWVADPVGCQVGSHEPIFPWYPSYLWNPPPPRQSARNPAQKALVPAKYPVEYPLPMASRGPEQAQSAAMPAGDAAAKQGITKDKAVEIVRALVARESGGKLAFDCEASEAPGEYKVFVTYGSRRDASGRLTGLFPGGHSLYRISKSGKVLDVIGGA